MMKRRKFIQQTVTAAAGIALAYPGFASIHIAPPLKPLGVALVGLGYYSTDLLAPALALTQHCRLTGIVTGTPSKAAAWQQRHKLADKNIYDYAGFDRIADNPDIDIVYIVLPPSMHAEYAIRAARAGKHVWCEKPMAMTTAECSQMIEACQKNKKKLSIGYRMHHEPNTQHVMRMAKELPYGKIKNVTAQAGYFDPRTDHWKQKRALGGGAMYDMGVYPLNAARYSTGREPIAVTARASTTRPAIYHEVEETMSFDLEFSDGITASCETSFGKGMNSLKVNCTSGGYSLEPFQAYSGINGITSNGILLDARIPNQQAKQMDDDAQAIIGNTTVMVGGEEGLKDIRVVEAIYKSVREKQRIVIG